MREIPSLFKAIGVGQRGAIRDSGWNFVEPDGLWSALASPGEGTSAVVGIRRQTDLRYCAAQPSPGCPYCWCQLPSQKRECKAIGPLISGCAR